MNTSTDSLGNPLPSRPILPKNATINQLMKNATVHTFLMCVHTSLLNGHTVVYNKKEKRAEITDTEGLSEFVSHN